MKEKVNKTDALTNNDLQKVSKVIDDSVSRKVRLDRLERWAEKIGEKLDIKFEK